MKKLIIILNLLLIFIIVGCSAENEQISTNENKIKEVGYFKINRNRIKTFSYRYGTTEQDIRIYVEKLMTSPGRMTAAYFYQEGCLIPDYDVISSCGGIIQANNIIYNAPYWGCWNYVYMKFFNGNTVFVDCVYDPNNDLCKKQ